MKTIDEKETQKQNKQTQKITRGAETLVKGWELNDFILHLS